MVTALRPKTGPPRSYRFPEFGDARLSSGVRLVTATVTKLPVVTILVVVDAGASRDPVGKEGLAALVASGIVEGSARYTGIELSEKFEQFGTSLEAGADWDSAFFKLTVLSDKLPEVLALLGEVLTSPAFPEREIERLKSERLAEILQLETEPRGLADEKFAEFVYAENSRYSKPDEGTAASVSALSRKDVVDFYESYYLTSAVTVVSAGDIRRGEIEPLVASNLVRLNSGISDLQQPVTEPRSQKKSIHIVNKPEAPQSELRVGHVGLPRRHPEFFQTLVMNAVLGGLFGSRINLNLREAHGYTYGASSHYDWRRAAGPFVISTAVQSDVTAPALREILSEIDRIRAETISEAELSLATAYLEGVFPIRYETTSAIASALASIVIYGLPADYYDRYRENIRNVSVGDVLLAAQKHIHPDELQTIVVGDASVIRASLAGIDDARVFVHDP
jgi:predicted Zn-dependent peptidase